MRKITLGVALLCVSMLVGCGNQPDGSITPSVEESTASSSSIMEQEDNPDNSVSTSEESAKEEAKEPESAEEVRREEVVVTAKREDIKRELMESMQQLLQPRVMDISSAGLESPEMDVKNIYYEITAEYPELKYAYDLTIMVQGTELSCQLHYMPYKTGAFPEDFSGEKITSMKELLTVAENHVGETLVPIRITNAGLEPDAMNRSLQQVGGGYILCMLNVDATALQYSVPQGMTIEDCVAALDLADDLAEEVISRVITADMSQREQAEAIYSYLTQSVTYDQRYYSDRRNMPYESQTAIGALRDHTAICGGYANALKLLYEKAGIPCYNISGRYFGEHHMWNLAMLDGEWLWFDATSDRGNSSEYRFLRFALTELDETKYQYAEQDIQQLLD